MNKNLSGFAGACFLAAAALGFAAPLDTERIDQTTGLKGVQSPTSPPEKRNRPIPAPGAQRT